MMCTKCMMNKAQSNGLCFGCLNSKTKHTTNNSSYPIKEVYTLLIDGTEKGEKFEFEGDIYIHDNNDLLQIVS